MTAMQPQMEALRCSFCGKAHDDVWKLFAGRHASICDECVDVCARIMAKDRRAESRASDAEGVCSPGDPGTTG
jgi:ATP-dependent Clp protease ATP-binding subunit ClpX